MTECNNALRALRAQTAIEAWVAVFDNTDRIDYEEATRDLLTDLQHYATARGYDFAQQCDRAEQMFLAEHTEVTP